MKENISLDSNLDMNKQNINTIIIKLSNSFIMQKYFIQVINQTLNQASSGDKHAIIKMEKINCILPNSIKVLGLPFCDLIIENISILNYYIDNYNNDKYEKISKEIIINFMTVFNFKLIDSNYIDNLLEHVKNKDRDFINIKENKRTSKTIIENLYDELKQLLSICKTLRETEEGLEEEEEWSSQLKIALKEKEDKVKEIEKKNILSIATIEFLKEKIKIIEDFINEQKNQKCQEKKHSKIITPKANINQEINGNPINNENDNSNIQKSNGLSEIEMKELREIELKNRTFFYKNEYLAYGEDELTEFKNYIYPLVELQEKELKRQYIGFLNNRGGRIYIGINDKKVVRGVILTYKDCNIFSNHLVGLSNDFYPKCRLDKIKVYFIPIKNSFTKKFINNLYVVKIIILSGDPYSLYSITKKGAFISAIRKQSQVFNLDAEEIANQIIERNDLKKNKENQIQIPNLNLEFNDPEPAKNIYISKNEDIKSEDSKSGNSHRSIKSNKSNKNNNIKVKKKDDKKCIYVVNVRNIDKNLKVREINKQFSGLQQCYQKFFSKEGKSLGYGKIHFVTEEAANAAIQKFNGNNLGGKKNIIMSLRRNKLFNRINK